MTEATRKSCTPTDYIHRLFDETADGKLTIEYHPPFDQSYSLTYRMNWTKADANAMAAQYESLTAALTRIAELHPNVDALTEQERNVWDTYIRPFDPFEADEDVVADLHFRHETDSLEEEDYELLERHYEWFVENSHKRLPFDKWCPSKLINRAQRYEYLARVHAAPSVLLEEGRFLAEELVLYHHAVKKLAFDSLKFIMAQSRTYETALAEIQNGQKRTHWMWFIFPQLRGLGTSDMSQTYGIADLDEARAYLASDVLNARLLEISTALLALNTGDPITVFGDVDAQKLRSSMTLFAHISEPDSVFHKVLQKFFGGQPDEKTLDLLATQPY